jgi:hypothetical protein
MLAADQTTNPAVIVVKDVVPIYHSTISATTPRKDTTIR